MTTGIDAAVDRALIVNGKRNQLRLVRGEHETPVRVAA